MFIGRDFAKFPAGSVYFEFIGIPLSSLIGSTRKKIIYEYKLKCTVYLHYQTRHFLNRNTVNRRRLPMEINHLYHIRILYFLELQVIVLMNLMNSKN